MLATAISAPWWALALGAALPWITLLVGLIELRSRSRRERVAGDVELMRAFVELGDIAAAKGDPFLSEHAVEREIKLAADNAHIDLRKAVANAPIASSQQAGAVRAIAVLATEHRKLLAQPAVGMIEGLSFLENDPQPELRNAYRAARASIEKLHLSRAGNEL
jgi:hypothetical protein